MSILSDVKQYCGIEPEDTYWDTQIVLFINTAFATLSQVIADSPNHFMISDDSAEWTDYLSDTQQIEWVKMNVCASVHKMFDPPTNSAHMEAINDIIAETQWRVFLDADNNVIG
jgi:hypothetical protein